MTFAAQSLLFLLLCAFNSYSRANPVVNTSLGWIEGLNNGDYSMFMGIPYAKVNASNPFGAAKPQDPFDGVFKAHDDTARCPQIEEFNGTVTGSLDCLHINIFTPNTSPEKKLPVLVSIHGGIFKLGFSGRYVYGPKFLVRHDIILVTFNYRLGPYGFMCLGIPDVPGNQGLKDQSLALNWIKNNIESFGGDPNKMTLVGSSSGAHNVDFHLIFGKNKFFDKMILQSASSLVPLNIKPSINVPQKLATYLGFNVNDVHEAISFLATQNPHKVIIAASELDLNFFPCYEQSFENVERFVTKSWVKTDIPNADGMSILIGYTKDENLSEYLNKTQRFFDNLNLFNEKLSLGFDIRNPEFGGMKDIVQHFYIGDEDQKNMNNIYDFGAFDSDFTFINPIHRSINRYLINNARNIYHYVFSYDGNRNFAKRRMNLNEPGVMHADELGYLYDISYYETISTEDQLIIDRMTTMWTNFVKYGNPTPVTSKLLPIVWTPITKASPLYCMDINLEMKLMKRNLRKRMAFWDLFYKANDNLQRHYDD